MVVEKFKPGKVKAVYQRFEEKGRMLPEGVHYINSWIDESISICYQLMEAGSQEQLQLWTDEWKDLVDFDIVPIISSAEAKKRIAEIN